MKTKTLKIIIIPTPDKTKISLNYKGYGMIYHENMQLDYSNRTHQHMYFTSDDEIKNNDLYIRTFDNKIMVASSQSDHKTYDCKKIEATTNIKLINDGLRSDTKTLMPSIPKSFIESYIKEFNANKPILTVVIETEEKLTKNTIKAIRFSRMNFNNIKTELSNKLNLTNKVIIVRFSTNDDEHILLLKEIFDKLGNTNAFMQNDLLGLRINTFLNDTKNKPKHYTEEEMDAKLTERTNLLVSRAMSFGATLSLKIWVEENL